jgi:hypothetical protein
MTAGYFWQLEERKLCEAKRIKNWVGQVYVLYVCINLGLIERICSLNNTFCTGRSQGVLRVKAPLHAAWLMLNIIAIEVVCAR